MGLVGKKEPERTVWQLEKGGKTEEYDFMEVSVSKDRV